MSPETPTALAVAGGGDPVELQSRKAPSPRDGERIDLVGGYFLDHRPSFHRELWHLVTPDGGMLSAVHMSMDQARAFAATLSPPAGAGAAGLDEVERLTIADYEEVLADHRRLARDLDVAMHGEAGAAKQASLCDLIEPARTLRRERDEARATLARQAADLERLRAAEGWQPIETAPKDGTRIDVWVAGRRITNVRWGQHDPEGCCPFGPEHWHGTAYLERGGKWIHRNPTHWRPLPAAPALSPDRGSEVRPEGGGEGGASDA